jgi:hypothetical protein
VKRSVRMVNKVPRPLKEVKIPNKLPKVLRDELDDENLSLAIDMGFDIYAVIEITGCVDPKTMKVVPAVQRLIAQADSYTEFVPRSEGIRIIGRSFGQAVDLDCDGESSDLADFTISIYHSSDRWVDISGIPILDKPFRNIEKLIEELLAEMRECIYLE